MWQYDTELAEVIQRTAEIKSFRFPRRDRNIRFLPGQFFFVTINIKGNEAVHHFSFSSSPTDKDYIEFTKRITASDYSQALNVMRPGDWARLRGPWGDFTLPRKRRPLAFVSGGIGITPLRSMVRYVTARDLPYDIVLIYGCKNTGDAAFHDELNEAASRSNTRVEYVLSGPDIPPGWKGKTGFINKDVIRELMPDYSERLFYVSGPPRMVMALEEQISDLDIPGNQVKRDYFPGYD